MTNVIKGKKIVIGIIAAFLLFDIFVSGITSSTYAIHGELGMASYKLLQGIFRFILTGLILFFFYKDIDGQSG